MLESRARPNESCQETFEVKVGERKESHWVRENSRDVTSGEAGGPRSAMYTIVYY